LAFGQASQPLVLPPAKPFADRVVAHGEELGQLLDAGPAVVAKHGLRSATHPGVGPAGGGGF